ncbi:hypothetical protein FG381_09730 [Sutterella faecalis]|uniref:Uncharacterized protein n=2 Tax=Sutterella TaxID=40544 RepID=A0AAI9SCC4_9BURK|nr:MULTISPECIES: hypothetical protein [Sutterella]KAB7651487.1 hypothetical protein GBM96_05700 [Sutterella seckii]QDA55182.1 hypothetical protein FG381_09730 [Sutterella faecalis]
MNRQEPVIDANAKPYKTLTERVTLSWKELLGLKPAAGPQEPTLGLEPESAAAPAAAPKVQASAPKGPEVTVPPADALAPKPFEPQPLVLSEEEKKAIIERLTPGIEASVREGLRDVLDLSVSNAVARMKGDLERTLSSLVTQAIEREIKSLKVDDIVKR